jgi:signal transduction histidine kinase/ActR/RegA family two-component response regulator
MTSDPLWHGEGHFFSACKEQRLMAPPPEGVIDVRIPLTVASEVQLDSLKEFLPKDHRIIEKGRMEFQPFGRMAEGKRIDDVSGVSMRVYVDCLEEVFRKKGREAALQATEELVQLLNDRIADPAYHITAEFLKNPWNSYSHEFSLYLTTFCSTIAEDPHFHLKVGKRLIAPAIRALGRPFSVKQIFQMCAHFGAKYVKAIRFEAVRIEENRALLRISFSNNSLRQFGTYRKGCVSEICSTIKAACSAVPEAVHDLLPAKVKDRSCVADGDPYCEWDITWDSTTRGGSAWWLAAMGFTLAALVVLRVVAPQMGLVESVLLSLIPGLALWELHSRFVLRQELRRRGEIIEEQALTTDARHEELREAYLEQEQHTADLRRKVSELTMLHKSGLLLTSIRDPEELISAALATLMEGLHFDRVLLSFYDPDSSILKNAWALGAGREVAAQARQYEVPITDPDSVEGQVVLRERPLLVTEMTEYLPRLHPTARALFGLVEISRFIIVPLKVNSAILGVITVSRLGKRPLTEDDLNVVTTFASQLSVGIDNARAYREIEELNAGLEAKIRERTAELEAANDHLRELDDLKSGFLAHVSHELRTPLTSIQGFADNMLARVAGPLTEKQQQYLKRIAVNTARLHRMIGNLLHRSSIEAKKIQISVGEVHLTQLIEEVLEQMQPLSQAKEQSLELVGLGKECLVRGDADKLRQVIINLVDNAIKYSPCEGRIRIALTQSGGGFAKVSVIDSGPGIPRDAVPKVFDTYYRVENKESMKVKGFGLGLSIVKTLVELHGGQVGIESEEGKGTTFHVTLPISERPIDAPDKVSVPVRRILVVDDDPDIREFLIDRLKCAGYAVRAASTGREAIGAIGVEAFEAVILDVGLPELDGIEVLQCLRSQNLTMPVLIITAAEARDRAMRALASGAQAYLLKPFNAAQFESAMDQCFGAVADDTQRTHD